MPYRKTDQKYDYRTIEADIDVYTFAITLAHAFQDWVLLNRRGMEMNKESHERIFREMPLRKDLEHRLLELKRLGDERDDETPYKELFLLYNYIPHGVYAILAERYALETFEAEA